MYDGDEFCLEPCLHITGDVFDHGGNGIPGHERGVDNYTKVLNLEVSLV